MDDEFGGLGVDHVEDEVSQSVPTTEAKTAMLGVGLRPVGDIKAVPRTESRKGSVDESSLTGFRKFVRNASSKLGMSPADSPNMGTANRSSFVFRKAGSRKDLFEAADVTVKDGEFQAKERRASSTKAEGGMGTRGSFRKLPVRGMTSGRVGLPPSSAAKASAPAANEKAEDDEDEEEPVKMQPARSSFRSFRKLDIGSLLGPPQLEKDDLELKDLDPDASLAKRVKELEREGMQKHSKAYSKIAVQRASSYSAPALIQGSFGVRWSVDPLVLCHNAVKEELSETYYLMSVLNRMFTGLSMDDIEMFFDHWEITMEFLNKYFILEESVVYARLGKHCTITGPLSRKERTTAKSGMQRTMAILKSDFETDLVFLPPSEALGIIKKKIDKVVSTMSQYMLTESKFLPALFEQYYQPTEKDVMEKEIVDYFFNETNGCMIHILLRWIKDATWRKYMMKKHFDRKRSRELLEKGNQYQRAHLNIVKKLNHRSKEVVVEMLEDNFAAETVPDFYREKVDREFEEEWEYYSDEDDKGATVQPGTQSTGAPAQPEAASSSIPDFQVDKSPTQTSKDKKPVFAKEASEKSSGDSSESSE